MMEILMATKLTISLLLLAIATTDGVVLGRPGDTTAKHADKGYINRLNYFTGVVTVCGITTCLAGTQVKPCVENYTMDTCEDCPKGFEMLDNTTSGRDVLSCFKEKNCSDYAYAISSTKENFCNHGTVRMPCECDAKNNWCGEPCNCKPPPVSCEPGQKLQHDCSCVPESSQIQPTKHTTISSTPSISTKDPSPTDQTSSRTSDPPTIQPSTSQNSKTITTDGKPHSSPTAQPDPVRGNNASPESEDRVSWQDLRKMSMRRVHSDPNQ
ncbi:hypothetical protein KP79_PYT21309 [Mizuhopecten yessoensis]|uniref:Uncharacterized protein n=1 Tax=Mizuhopecten yessoensis TaxID=6573 RepID=A0A210PL32_MIZYE|nr:hypothetical protein KP79_PYT21309 [Mizuhopecten yessoensis]